MGRRNEAERFFANLLARDPHSAGRSRRSRIFAGSQPTRPAHRAICTHALDQEPKPRPCSLRHGAVCCAVADPRRGTRSCSMQRFDSDPNLIDAVQVRALVRARLGEPAASTTSSA